MVPTSGLHIIFASFVLLLISHEGKTYDGIDISGIINNLFTGYDKRIRPNFSGPPVDVSVNMYVISISSVSEVTMDFTMDIYFRQFWNDPRLRFQPRPEVNYVNLDSTTGAMIWAPDTFFSNEKKSYYHYATVPNSLTKISSNGDVFKSVRLTITASCPMDLGQFPMDSQLCSLEIENYSSNMKDIIYRWNTADKSVGISPHVELPQFKIKGHREKTINVELKTGNYSRLVVELLFVRSTGYYILQIYFPAFLIVMVSWVAFWLNRNNMLARVALAITTVLTITTLMSSINASLPKISYIKNIDVYLIFCFVMVFVALMEHAAIDFISSRTYMSKPTAAGAAPYAKNVEGGGTSVSTVANRDSGKDRQIMFYEGRQEFIDKYSRIGFPVVFFCFNILYCIICSLTNDLSTDNMIPVKVD